MGGMKVRLKQRWLVPFSRIAKGYPFKDDNDIYLKLAEPLMDPVYGTEFNCVSLTTGGARRAEPEATVEPVMGAFIEDGSAEAPPNWRVEVDGQQHYNEPEESEE